jgi:hypothetical protein
MSEDLEQVVTRGSSSKGMGEYKNAYIILMVISEGNKPLGIPRCGREDNIKMYLKEIRSECVDWNYLVRVRDHCPAVVNTVTFRFHKIQEL